MPADEIIRQQVAQAAYFSALRRGFEPGHELEDWLEAERDVVSSRGPTADLSADILLVTVGDTESDELLSCAQRLGIRSVARQGLNWEYVDLGLLGSVRVTSIRVGTGAFSHDGAASKCIRACIETGATTVMAVGTAFGTDPAAQQVGDVLVSEHVLFYDRRDVEDHPTATRGYTVAYPPEACPAASPFWVERFTISSRWFAQQPEPIPVRIGTLLSGGSRISSAAFRNELRQDVAGRVPSLVGGEMEAAGLVASVRPEEQGWIVVKGISDFADPASRRPDILNPNRRLAAARAATVSLRTIANFSGPLQHVI